MTLAPKYLFPLALALVLGVLPAARSLPGDSRGRKLEPEKDVDWMIRRGDYLAALERSERAHQKDPTDPDKLRDYRNASTAILLDEGRRALFDDRIEEALDFFLRAREISPDPLVADEWIYNARLQLADDWHDQGMVAQMAEDLERAVECYELALKYKPEYDRARTSLMRILLQINYRDGMSEEYYNQGVRAIGGLQLDEAHQKFSYAHTYDEDNERALERRQDTRTRLAERRVFLAEQLERDGNFAGARNEYRMALLLDPELEIAAEGFVRADRERDAAQHLRVAERRILRREFDLAETALEEGRALTVQQLETFDAMSESILEARLFDRYEAARTLESDQQYEQAVVAYDALLEQAPFYKDTITRRDTLRSYVEEAAKLYGLAMKEAPKSEERARYLRRIDVFWPEYRDVRQRLDRIEGVQK